MTDTSLPPAAEIRGLTLGYRTRQGLVAVLHDISFSVGRGEVVALVGESGSGKSTLAHALLGLLSETAEISARRMLLDGVDVTDLDEAARRRLHGRKVAQIPQDPTMTLNPLQRIGRQTVEPLRIHGLLREPRALSARAVELLARVGIGQPEARVRQYPGALSGGMRQRVLIASALSSGPALLLADEPTTALDVTVQKRILDDLGALLRAEGLSVLLVTHDLAVAADRADRVIVLKDGRRVEQGPVAQVLRHPRAAYTRLLIDSAPQHGPVSATVPSSVQAGAAPILQVEAVVKDFAQGAGQLRAVDGISLSVHAGETVALVGESGSGKTTLGLLAELRARHGIGYLFVSHDLAVVRRIADRVLVMRAGQLVEAGPTHNVFDRPRQGHTRDLLAAIPGQGLSAAVSDPRHPLLPELEE
ncbi:ATP-binding cassette domain-containing protein [Rhodobacter sp. 24-YEA-8]|uniref:ATP-binding cassette domain-containing protein n=1 Tax=Rhodobacter sp. 24-YEA-8 TaxID=1884310 RepID=UPI00089D0B98|nr:ATP-binding cassette domain-containing protein [Rhodobacter sp. 24-YEA-8]SED88087.1 peptide/nickel transport system ATP-binding protein [Rhodobacter sp. 24-YEA-8]